MDELDIKAIKHLMKSGRASWAELSGVLGLSSPSTSERVRRLEETGVIKGYAAIVEPALVDCALTAFVSVTLEHSRFRAAFLERVCELPQIQECHHVTGDYDYLLKIRCRSSSALEQIITDELKELPGMAKTTTIVALSTNKETTELAIEHNSINQALPNRQ